MRELSLSDKCELIDALWEDIETRSELLSDMEAEELDRRLSACRQDPTRAITWDQVKATVLQS